MDNLFFAILPDREAKARIAALVARLRGERELPGSPVAPDRLHVSLHWVGDETTPAAVIRAAKTAAAAIDAPCFQLAFDRASSFNGPRRIPLVLTSSVELPSLTAIRRSLSVELERAGLECPMRTGFTPHLTFLYTDRPVDPIEIDPVAWTVREFVLIRSLYGRRRHLHLARWPLRN